MNVRAIRTTTFVLAVICGASGHAAAETVTTTAVVSRDFAAACHPAAQAELDFAVAAYHALDQAEVEAGVDRALRADSGCAMAHWLRALALLGPPAGWKRGIPQPALARGRLALDHAREAGLATERERDAVDALAVMYADNDAEPGARLQAFEAALVRLVKRHADDAGIRALLVAVRAADCAP